MICKNCGNEEMIDFELCNHCGYNMLVPSINKIDKPSKSQSKNNIYGQSNAMLIANSNNIGSGPINLLVFFGWLDLVFSVVASIYIWVKEGFIESSSYYSSSMVINPAGIGLGIGVMIQGLIFWALLLVVAKAAENILIIRNATVKKV